MPPLPKALEEVRPPECFGPSRFAELLRCPLSVIHGLHEDELLPPHPLAILGEIIHKVMYEVKAMTPDRGELGDEVAAVFENEVAAAETRLAADPATGHLIPLRRAVGRKVWRSRKARLLAWAAAHATSTAIRAGRKAGRRPRSEGLGLNDTAEATTGIPLGSEQSFTVTDLRLSGRPDRIDRDRDGVFHVTDFKSGSVSDKDGRVFEEYALQMRLYAFMITSIIQVARVRLWLEGSERIEVPWNDAIREEIEELLRTTLVSLPYDRSLAAESLARAGPHCERCRIRHRCTRYQHVAPSRWVERSTTAPVAPFDVWGVVSEVGSDVEASYEVLLRDAAGRTVRVSGVEAGAGVENLRRGDHAWFFDVESSEILPRHGAFTHPRNFHVKRPSRAWADALRIRIFTEPTHTG